MSTKKHSPRRRKTPLQDSQSCPPSKRGRQVVTCANCRKSKRPCDGRQPCRTCQEHNTVMECTCDTRDLNKRPLEEYPEIQAGLGRIGELEVSVKIIAGQPVSDEMLRCAAQSWHSPPTAELVQRLSDLSIQMLSPYNSEILSSIQKMSANAELHDKIRSLRQVCKDGGNAFKIATDAFPKNTVFAPPHDPEEDSDPTAGDEFESCYPTSYPEREEAPTYSLNVRSPFHNQSLSTGVPIPPPMILASNNIPTLSPDGTSISAYEPETPLLPHLFHLFGNMDDMPFNSSEQTFRYKPRVDMPVF
ncbi:hypothetical protein DACRYDRAFT_22371 [Dacryopinax primogenitus]|uniref:Zn(2)-C6 fungal-type domain-containing protein n=1 Tax=Dacryopinax primogenitus (strain DJM 731) TaxID=1858805 RepID=M5FZJ8_DACPD|nr:uncharacterized protein DACRYDRAFT_22371 [Dacryopinax primogenitus]EJU01939.1 hypothetical protein DACRYDRAFT_22371 [Dacryopinax primogenitus]